VRVEVVFSPAPRLIDAVMVSLSAGATASDALIASGIEQRHGLEATLLRLAVWGRRCALSRVLHDGDRLECCRPLAVDPKQARRLRGTAQRVEQPKAKRPAGAGR
jgi:uncharacterized protein